MSSYSEEVGPIVEQVKRYMAQGDKKSAQELVRQFGTRWQFPALDKIMEEYDDADRGGKWLWGQWGTGNDLVAEATSYIKESFIGHAANLMIEKGTAQGMDLVAAQAGVQGAQYVCADDEACPLCKALDGLQCLYPSQEYDDNDIPQHCGCYCGWTYIDEQEENFQPDEDWHDTVLQRINDNPDCDNYDSIESVLKDFGHANPYWERTQAKDDVDMLVSLHVMAALAEELGLDMNEEEDEEED